MKKTVTYKVDLNKPPVLSEEQKARLEALDKRADSEIDFSDIPELDERFWTAFFQKLSSSSGMSEKSISLSGRFARASSLAFCSSDKTGGLFKSIL